MFGFRMGKQKLFQGSHSASGKWPKYRMACRNRLQTMVKYCSDRPIRLCLVILAIAAQYLLRACLQRHVRKLQASL
jgi:hypothetical protein